VEAPGWAAGRVARLAVGPGGSTLPCLLPPRVQAWQPPVEITEGRGVRPLALPGKPHLCSTGQGQRKNAVAAGDWDRGWLLRVRLRANVATAASELPSVF